MRRLGNSLHKGSQIKSLSPSLLKIIEPDKEDEFERKGDWRSYGCHHRKDHIEVVVR
jgi:hypothetical protein